MTWASVAIAVHLLAVLWWIGGLAFVTLVFLPALRSDHIGNRHILLDAIERRFAPQARTALLLVGASGAYLLWALGAWRWLSHAQFWWLHAMIGYWLLFFVMLFVIEPLGLLRRATFPGRDPVRAWRRFHALHAILLGLGIAIVAAAAAGSHHFISPILSPVPTRGVDDGVIWHPSTSSYMRLHSSHPQSRPRLPSWQRTPNCLNLQVDDCDDNKTNKVHPMTDKPVESDLAEQDFFIGLEPSFLTFLAGCATPRRIHKDETLYRHERRADRFYLLREGRISIEVAAITGPPLEMLCLDPGDIAGWSWLIPPYRWHFQARAVEDGEVLEFDGDAILARCESDPKFGYELFKRVSGLMSRRLAVARERMMDEWQPSGFA